MLNFWSSLVPQHLALTMFFLCQFQHLTVGVSAHWNGVETHSLLTEKKHLLEEKKNRKEKQNGMQFSRVYPPHVSSTVFLAGWVIHRKALAHNTLYLNTKETSQPGVWASETNRRLAHHHRENECWALHWLILLMQALQTKVFLLSSSLLQEPFKGVPWRSDGGFWNHLGNRRGRK